MDQDALDTLLQDQDHVFTRSQVIALGGDDNLIRRKIRRREWAVVWLGVFVDHRGEPTRAQREWAAVLHYAPAALTGHAALQAYGVRTGRDTSPRTEVIEVAVERSRRVVELPGTAVVRTSRLSHRAAFNLSPPRVRLEYVVLDLAAAGKDEIAVAAVLADACQSRRTTARRLLDVLDERSNLRRRALIRRVLDDIDSGANSVLEWLFLTRVERPHGLRAATRQIRATARGRTVYRDVEYRDVGVVVELDGRLGHTRSLDRWDDLDRDLDAVAAGRMTVRLGWRQVAEPCRTARALSRILIARGWTGPGAIDCPDCR